MTLIDIINDKGLAQVARDLNVHVSYVSKLRSGKKPVSAKILAKAMVKYGREFDATATLRLMRAGELGQDSALPPEAA